MADALKDTKGAPCPCGFYTVGDGHEERDHPGVVFTGRTEATFEPIAEINAVKATLGEGWRFDVLTLVADALKAKDAENAKLREFVTAIREVCSGEPPLAKFYDDVTGLLREYDKR